MDNPEAKAGININVGGNMQGHIVIGDGNTIIEQKALPTQRRSLSPKPPRKPAFFIGRSSELQQLEDYYQIVFPSGHQRPGWHWTDLIGETGRQQ